MKLSRLQALEVSKGVGPHIRDEVVVEIDVSEALGSLKGLEVDLGDEVVACHQGAQLVKVLQVVKVSQFSHVVV